MRKFLSLWILGLLFSSATDNCLAESPLKSRSMRDFAIQSGSKAPELSQLLIGREAITASDYSYAFIVPYVTSANNLRTNLGINNYSTNSLTNGSLPTAKVQIMLFDAQGSLRGGRNFTVRSNEMYQINDVTTSFGLSSGTGWLLIYSDEPFTAWASIISNSSGDPSIEMGVPVPFGKFDAYISGLAVGVEPAMTTRLLVPSSTKLGAWQSSLVVTNASTISGSFQLKIYNNTGQLASTRTVNIAAGAMYLNNDIRDVVSGTYGQIVVEPQTYGLVLLASSIVKNENGMSAFFPAQTLLPASAKSLAGAWEGTISTNTSGTITAKLKLFQEGSMLYGFINMSGGVFSQPVDVAISGELIDQSIVLDLHHWFSLSTGKLIPVSMRLMAELKGAQLEGLGMYVTPTDYEDGTFTLTRARGAYE